MKDYEKLGLFYLGRLVDPATGARQDDLLLYDSKDLVTHAVCVGMTGSGKTGLGITLIEEAAIDGVPAIVIDPKGDLANLLLTFPALSPSDFAPWVNEDDARRNGQSPSEFAADQAARWQKGLNESGQTGERIQRLRDAVEFGLYTPGSEAGTPVSILRSFAPPVAPATDSEALRERVANTTTSLLGFLKIEADPVTSREHILISTLLDRAWRDGRQLDLATLIQQVQSPPVTRIGVLDLDSFFPAKERFALAMSINNLLASPGFGAWLEGEPLDIGALLHTAKGKPRVSIFSIAHLGDTERMFFVSLLLNEVIAWMRAQPGTTSLRALLYMDEIFGYFPPVANPSSKQPLLTLLKQARAYGLGVVLATQNPVDLDYKGLSNAGTWFIGRLQTERDKLRLLDGLESVVASAGTGMDRARADHLISNLPKRTFLMNNIHDSAPAVFETRWTLSYLRGPLARTEIKRLAGSRPADSVRDPTGEPEVKREPVRIGGPSVELSTGLARPVLPPGVSEYFIPRRQTGGSLVYVPLVLAATQVRLHNERLSADQTRTSVYLAPLSDQAAAPVSWEDATLADFTISDLETSPENEASFLELPAPARKAANYGAWGKDVIGWLYRTQSVDVLKSAAFDATAKIGESERDFRARLQQNVREDRDSQKERLRQKYSSKMAALDERRRRAQQAVERESEQATSRKIQTAVSFGATVLGALMGRKTVSSTTLGRATTAARDVGRSMKEQQDVARARETVTGVDAQRAALEEELRGEIEALETRTDPATIPLETVTIKPKKSDIAVQLIALVWAPYTQDSHGNRHPAY